MASSENLDDFFHQWVLHPSFTSPAANAAIVEALKNSVSSADNSPSVPSSNSDTSRGGQSISVSGSGFGSDQESHETNSKTKRSVPGPAIGRIAKRKPRASKKSPTTFITADAANFRQMVQDVTGVKFPSPKTSIGPLSTVVKPEPQRFGAAAAGGALIYGCLPTLDTSAPLIDIHNRQQALVAHAAAAASQTPVVEIGGGSGGGLTAFDFDSFACFPTLESWKVM